MEVSRLLAIIEELLEEEEKYKIQDLLNRALNSMNSNNNVEAENIINELKKYTKETLS